MYFLDTLERTSCSQKDDKNTNVLRNIFDVQYQYFVAQYFDVKLFLLFPRGGLSNKL